MGESGLNSVQNRENYQKALEMYYESAEKGHAFSQLQLGKMFLLGMGVEQDYKAALEWYQKSVAQGNGEAQAYLGEMYEKGLGVDRDIQKALELYKQSAAQGNALGQARLAALYLAGMGVEQNPRVAFVWYEKSAAQGNGEAQAYLGHLYEKGLGVNRDIRQAAELYKKSAAQDNALGQLKLADFYSSGIGVERNPRRAFAWYQKAAAQDQEPEIAAQAQLKMGAMYCQGNGVEKDLKKGFEFYEKAAKLGYAEAQFCLGAMYEDGVGVERDHKKALEWFQKSSKKSKTPANSAMGDIYRDGLVVEKNIPEAISWYKKAADAGDPYAKSELLKLQLEVDAQQNSPSAEAPVDKATARPQAEAADTRPAATGIAGSKEKARKQADKTVEGAALPLRGKLRSMPRPQSAKRQMESKPPEKKAAKPVGDKIRQPKQARASRNLLYLFSAIGTVVAALVVITIGLNKTPAPTWESVKLGAMEITALPRPDPRSLPAMTVRLPGDFLKKIRAAGASRKKIVAPVVEAVQAPAVVQPTAPLLRREYKSLDEAGISRMLATRNIFDAKRNPGGNFPHRFEIKNSAGLRLIVDRATGLAWARQGNPVRMNLKKSLDWIASLNNVAYGGDKNWRLPTIEEAAALLQKNPEGKNSFLDAIFGEGLGMIWTGDGFTGSESWAVDFQNGLIDQAKNKSKLAILMVSSSTD